MRWDRADIGKTLERLNIDARRRGREWYALCPNPGHKDSDPSWRMRDEPGSEKHGKHHCYPCGYKGTLVSLVMEKLVTDFPGACAWFEGNGLQGADAPVPSLVQIKVRSLKPKFRMPPGVHFGPLSHWVSVARDYAVSRGITPEQVIKWGLGYAVDGRLGSRIVIPYRDANGIARGYTARTFIKAPSRYMEPKPEEKANKAMVFGEQYWPGRQIRKASTIYVVEGALNALAIERAYGSAYVGATGGSDAIEMRVMKIGSFGNVVLVTDPDAAGDKQAAALQGLLARHCIFSRVRLPEGKDAADLSLEELRSWLGSTSEPT